MLMQYPLHSYRDIVRRVFGSFLLQDTYASNLPDYERMIKFLSRFRHHQITPHLEDEEQIPSMTGLPEHWSYWQYNRSALVPVEEDDFRREAIRVPDITNRNFTETKWGFGRCVMNNWIAGNTGSVIELLETLYYARLYRIRSLEFMYQNMTFVADILHSPLQEFGTFELRERGTGWFITWETEFYVPLLVAERVGTYVMSVLTNIFDSQDTLFPNATTTEARVPTVSLPSFNTYGEKLITEPTEPSYSGKLPGGYGQIISVVEQTVNEHRERDTFLIQEEAFGDGTYRHNIPPIEDPEHPLLPPEDA